MPTVSAVLDDAERVLQGSDAIDHPHAGRERADAEDLLAFVVGRDPEPDERIDGEELRRYRRLIGRRVAGEPAPYIIGSVEFHGLTLAVGPGAFIPRESSEFMADQALRRLRGRRSPTMVDLATGVGPVALSVASSAPDVRVFGVDLSRPPIALAKRNASALGVANARFLQGDLFEPLPRSLRETVDVITVHPPYVGRREVRTLPEEIRRFEPIESLTDRSPAGMGLVTRTADEAPGWLAPRGWLLVEVSPDRSRTVATILRRAGFEDVRSTKGPVPVTRVIVGRSNGARSHA